MELKLMGHKQLSKEIFEFLSKKYVQRADARQQATGLQYTEAETHDFATEISRWLYQHYIILGHARP